MVVILPENASCRREAEIIQVLRSLLQDHKDFIRQQLGSELSLPSFSEAGAE